VVGLLVAVAGAVVAFTIGSESMAPMMAPLLFGFGCYKGAIALDTLLTRRRNPEAYQRIEQHHGSRSAVTSWIVYKFAAMAVAWLAAGSEHYAPSGFFFC
jgi:hypothetical protein